MFKIKDCKLYHGDCLEVMDKLISEGIQVDLTVTSPPYDKLRTYNNTLKWNERIWKQVIKRLYAITKDGGVVVWVVGDATIKGSETGTSFKQALYFKEVGFNLHDTMIYQKINYTPLTHNRYEQSFEFMFIFSKKTLKIFNPILIPCKQAGKLEKYGLERRKNYDTNHAMRVYTETEFKTTKQTKIKSNIFAYSIGRDKTGHPAPFPEQLANDHIISWSNEGDIVFDPFMGSGTTGKMALLNNRKFIGIEKVEEYFNIAKERIYNTTKDKV